MPDSVPYDCFLSTPAPRWDALLLQQQNPFARRNVTASVLEVPSELIGEVKINAWALSPSFAKRCLTIGRPRRETYTFGELKM